MNGPTRRLAAVVMGGFLVLVAATSWFQVLGAERYRSDPRNVRAEINLTQRERGLIVAGDGTVLARSEADPGSPQVFDRTYPEGEAWSTAIGYTTFLVGDAGLEAAYADELRSRRDLTISDLLAALFGRDLRPQNVQTTLQPIVQEAAYEALGGQTGAVVALDPKTGAVLAYVSSPGYDPNSLLGSDAVEVRQRLLDHPAGPLVDRAGRELFPPGSTFKTLVAAAAIEVGIAGPETEFDDPVFYDVPGSDSNIANAGGGFCGSGTTVSLQTAFVRSCNTVFADLAVQLGAGAIGGTAEELGFGDTIAFPWDTAVSRFPTDDLISDRAALAQSGIGERDVRVTTLQMAMVAAAVANDGLVLEPRLVAQVFDADGSTLETFEPQRSGRAMSNATAAVVAQMMERVVTEGTGTRATVPGIRVAGKTGTAEGSDGPDVWFIGFAPVEDPVIALAVVVEGGGDAGDSASGGTVAAPIAARVLDAWLNRIESQDGSAP